MSSSHVNIGPNGQIPTSTILSYNKCTHGNKVTVQFPDETYTFHSQWLHDAHCDGPDGAARNSKTAICQQPAATVHVETLQKSLEDVNFPLDITWDDGQSSKFPAPWLKVMAPLVASKVDASCPQVEEKSHGGWTVDTLRIPEVSYLELFREGMTQEELNTKILSTIDKVLSSNSAGIIKIIDLPPPNIAEEKAHTNNLVTRVLKKLFGSVFHHPIRGPDQTFNVSSHSHDATRKEGLPNYDTSQLLLPHSDHAFYTHPAQVQGFYGLEGSSENTWVSVEAALHTLKSEDPRAYERLCKSPMAIGRCSRFYGEPLYQAIVDTTITTYPGSEDFKRLRWHPNLTGSLLSSYENYKEDREAHRKFQEILRSKKHQLKMELKPGDLYVWDNFRLLHGRERVFDGERTAVGQTVEEQIVQDRWRKLCIEKVKASGMVEDKWLVHLPMGALRELVRIVDGEGKKV